MLAEQSMEERLRLLEKAVRNLADQLAEVRRRLEGEVEAQALEIAALKCFLATSVPDFHERYPGMRESAIRGGTDGMPSGA